METKRKRRKVLLPENAHHAKMLGIIDIIVQTKMFLQFRTYMRVYSFMNWVFSTTFQLPLAVLNKLWTVSIMHFNTGTFNTFCLVYIDETGQIPHDLSFWTHSP
jgi:hypothetical protein